MYGASLKKDTSMRVQLSNGNTVILTRASDSTYAGTYTVASGINAARDNTSNLTAEEYEVGDAEDDKGNHLLLDVEGIEDAPAFQPTETIVVVVRAPEISSITYTPSSDPPLTTGDYVDIVATCTTSPSTELAQGTAVILQLSNGSDVTLTKTGPKTYAGRYNVVAHDDCDHLTASGYEVGTAADKAGNPMVPCDDFVRKRIKVDDQGKEKTSTGELPLPPAYSISVKGAAFQPTSNIAINTEPAVVPPPVLVSIEYSPDNGRQKEGDTVVITATCSKSKPLKKETTITVALSNGRNIVLDRASDNTYVGKYVIQRTGSSVLGYSPSSEQKDDTEDTDDLLAVGYDVGTAEDENGGALVADSPVAGVAAMQPSGHLSVATKIPELIKIEYVIERFGKGAGAGAGAGKATGQATTEDQKPLEAGDKIVITATCTHASSSELKRGTEMTLLMSNGKSVILKHDGRGYDDTYVGEYVIGPDASEDCDVLGASGYNCGTAEDEHGNALDANTTIQSASMFQPTQPIVIDTQASARAAARAAADAKTAAEAKAAAAAQEKAAAAQEKAAAAARTAAAAKAAEDTRIVAEAAAAAAAAAAIAAESAAQTEARKARVQTELKAMLLGDTNTWTYTLSPSMKINEQENVDVNQGGDGGARGELAVGLYGVNDVDVLVVYSHSDQIFTMEQDLKVGNTIIPQASIIDLNLITLSNKIRFKPNTTIVVDECKHICRRVAKLLNINPDIRIRVDGHVKMKKKYRKDPAMMGQAERLSELRAKSVVQELVVFGIDAPRMDHKGFGGSKPLPKGQDDKRVEISVL
jgi:outer membrane protein OmpA-like peptidoglycan-associated protein